MFKYRYTFIVLGLIMTVVTWAIVDVANSLKSTPDREIILFIILLVIFLIFSYTIQKTETNHHHLEKKYAEDMIIYNIMKNSISQQFFVKNLNSVFLTCNASFANLFGKSTDEIIGLTDFDLFTADMAQKHIADDRKVIENNIILKFEEKSKIDRKEHLFEVFKSPTYNEQGEITGVIGIYFDVSEREKMLKDLNSINLVLEAKVDERTIELAQSNELLQNEIKVRIEAEAALGERNKDLERSNGELQQFAYIASHDLQEPLRKIQGFSSLLEKRYKGQLDDTADKYIHFIVDGTQRMHLLINDLLSYSRVNTRAKEFEPVNSRKIIEYAKDMVLNEGMDATIELPEFLPVLYGDETQIGQVFINLLANAVKFRKDAAPFIQIDVKSEADFWVFAVKDNGIGIEKEYSERIFEMFKRLHTKEEYPGTGIGLALCKKIINRHGGEIWVESEVGTGSTFFFSIPKKEEKLNAIHKND